MRLYFICISLLACTSAFAQQHFFLYIQTENKQPFYIKMKGKVYSSSATGYVVIPKLVPDTYQMQVGFNKDAYPEQEIRCIVDKDAGYLLKNYAEKGWGLLNLQTGEIVMNTGAKKPEITEDDAFSKTLSQVVNTPDLKTEEKKEEKKEQKKEVQPEVAVNNIRLLMNNGDHTGRQMVYSDGQDTVRIFIPGEVVIPVPAPVTEVKVNKEEEKGKEQVVLKEAVIKKEPVKDTIIYVSTELAKTTNEDKVDNPAAVSNNCGLLAGNDDFLKLRKKMAAEKSDELMISSAKKQFKTRCFATEQIKNLSVLFLTDEGRYKFLDASYPYVHDLVHFASLQSTLTDNYYRNRFKAMISR